MPDSFDEEVVYQSNLYRLQKGLPVNDLVNLANLRCTEACLLLSGYNCPPRRKMMWEQRGDCINTLVASNIRRETVDLILKSLHFRDNTKMSNSEPDIYFKVYKLYIFVNLNIFWFNLSYFHITKQEYVKLYI